MARHKWIWDEKKQELVPEGEYRSEPRSQTAYVHDDTIIGGLWHPADGNMYDSKSKFRQITKQYGCVEKDNQTSATLKNRREERPSVRDDVLRVLEKQGYRN